MNRRTTVVAALFFLGVVLLADITTAQGRRRRSSANSPQARPPKWDLSVLDIFFADATKELGQISPRSHPTQPSESTIPASAETPKSGQLAWSRLIAAEAIEDEVKSLTPVVVETTKSPRRFKTSGYLKARDSYSLLATLFGVIAQFDQDVRWQADAARMRDALARAGSNCKAGSDQTFREAKARAEDLSLIMRGESPELPKPEAEPNWTQVADREPLMKRMQMAQDQLSTWTSQSSEFEQNQDQLLHEAQILAMLAEVLKDQEYEYADEESFQEYLRVLQESCLELLEATRQNSIDKAQEAAGAIYKSCNACHDEFRG